VFSSGFPTEITDISKEAREEGKTAKVAVIFTSNGNLCLIKRTVLGISLHPFLSNPFISRSKHFIMSFEIAAKSGDGPQHVSIPKDKFLGLSSIVLDTSTVTEGPGLQVVFVYTKIYGRDDLLIAILTKENPNKKMFLGFKESDMPAFFVKGPEGASARIIGNIYYDDGMGSTPFFGMVAKSGNGPQHVSIPKDNILGLEFVNLDTSTLTEGPEPQVISVYAKTYGRADLLITILTKKNPSQIIRLGLFKESDMPAFFVKGPEGASVHFTGNIVNRECVPPFVFWGTVAKSGDKPQHVSIPEGKIFKVSSIILDTSTVTEGPEPQVISVYTKIYGRDDLLIAILTKKNPSQILRLGLFNKSHMPAFFVKGPEGASVHFTGNIVDEDYLTSSLFGEDLKGI
jgi:hypothetical protein